MAWVQHAYIKAGGRAYGQINSIGQVAEAKGQLGPPYERIVLAQWSMTYLLVQNIQPDLGGGRSLQPREGRYPNEP